jgi:hypothetical protein
MKMSNRRRPSGIATSPAIAALRRNAPASRMIDLMLSPACTWSVSLACARP